MGSLTLRDLEIAAVSISVAAGCQPCLRHHVRAATDLGATPAEVSAAVATGASAVTGSTERIACGFLPAGTARSGDSPAVDGMVLPGMIGAAVARNDVASLKKLIKQARESGISEESVSEVAALALRIREKAASRVRAVLAPLRTDPESTERANELCE